LKALPLHRVAMVIEEELKGMRKDRFWNGSQNCNEPSGGEARNFCKKYADRQTELAAAAAAEKLNGRITQLSREVEGLKALGAGQGKDPQLLIVSTLSGLDIEGAKSAIAVFVAVLVELGAAFGLFLAMGHSFNHLNGESRAALAGARDANRDKPGSDIADTAPERVESAGKAAAAEIRERPRSRRG